MKDIGDNTFVVLIIAIILAFIAFLFAVDKTIGNDGEEEALKNYYEATERLLDTLNINECDSVFSTRAGFEYLKAHEEMEKFTNR